MSTRISSVRPAAILLQTFRAVRFALVLLLPMTDGVASEGVVAVAPSPAVKEQCGAEFRSLCLRPWRLTPTSIANCIAEHREDLSPVCQSFWDTAHACQLEMQTICGGLFPLTIKSCLSTSQARFSPLCQQVLDLH